MSEQRTIQQNKAIHLLADWWAEALCEQGQDMREVLTIPIKPTGPNVKAGIIIPTIAKMFPELEREDGTFHTSDLSTTQVDLIYEAINRGMGERFGIHVPFPDRHGKSA